MASDIIRPNVMDSDRGVKRKILVVDDNETNVELICMHLKPFPYEIIKAYNGEEALQKIQENEPDLILLDLMMPKVSGYEVCQKIKSDPKTALIPVIIITALRELDDKIKALELGADDFLIKPFNKIELITRIKSLLRMKVLLDEMDHAESMVFALVEALEAKDIYTRGHSERVAKYSMILAREMGMTEQEVEVIRKGSLLHDIGKIGVKDAILNKVEKLTQEEIAHIRTHPARGYEICKSLKSFKAYLPCIRWHHERMDGKGLPDGIPGEKIPTSARICAITDAFDAMTSNRPYRKGISPLQASNIFERERDSGQWDPDIIDVFVNLIRKSYQAAS
ncbi:MAG: response regulator [Deltaproteobacteria bacterium]|nr:response regulator [Deltaproteobacteria bacterium]